jgi:hypothetical protein
VDGPDPDCNDGVECTVDDCIEASDSCSHTADNHLCDDDDECTVDLCAGTGCVYISLCGACCLDDDTCTDDVRRLACTDFGGTFHGQGTACEGDLNGNGLDDLCEPDIPDEIPTMSTWGLAVVALVLLIGGRVLFGRRRHVSA